MARIFIMLVLGLVMFAFLVVAPTRTVDAQNSWQGTGNNLGSGWRSDSLGGLRGTGNNLGSGWRSDGLGGLRGTGNNLGSGWRSD